MQEHQVTVNNPQDIVNAVKKHGGVTFSLIRGAEKHQAKPKFICRAECKDGTVINFYAKNDGLASKIAAKLNPDSDTIMQQYADKFVELVSDPDPFVFTIKGQLYLESLINSIINGSHYDPDTLDLDRIRLDVRIDICSSAGLIHNDVAAVLKKLGELRNRFVHRLHPSLTAKDEKDFLNVLRKSARLKKKLLEASPTWEGVRAGIYVLYFYLLEQLFKVASNQIFLYEYWQNLVDAQEEELTKKYITFGKPWAIDLSLGNDDDPKYDSS